MDSPKNLLSRLWAIPAGQQTQPVGGRQLRRENANRRPEGWGLVYTEWDLEVQNGSSSCIVSRRRYLLGHVLRREHLTGTPVLNSGKNETGLRSERSSAVAKWYEQERERYFASLHDERKKTLRAIRSLVKRRIALPVLGLLCFLCPIMRGADLMARVTRNAKESIARIRLAIREPRINARFPGLECDAEVSPIRHAYTWQSAFRPFGASGSEEVVLGEEVTINLRQGGTSLIKRTWSTNFPYTIQPPVPTVLPAEVTGEDLMVGLLSRSALTPEDLTELVHSRIPEVRIGAAANLTDQTVLTTVALQDKEPSVRVAAVRKLTDQALLAKFVLQDKEPGVRIAAVKKLTDQVLLAKVALQDKEPDVRIAASAARQLLVESVTDQASLTKLVGKDEDFGVRRGAIEKLTDQALLATLASEDQDSLVRLAAVKKLTDHAVLAKVALQDKEPDVRLAAVKELTDQTALATVVSEDNNLLVRLAAVEKLTDQTLLAKLANEDKHDMVRKAVVERLTDQAVLATVALQDKSVDVRIAAVKKLTDQAVLAKVASEDSDSFVRYVAAQRISRR